MRSYLTAFLALVYACPLVALDRAATVSYKVFQFPPNMIPRIDGNTDDWAMVPEGYSVGSDQLVDDSAAHAKPDPKTSDVRVKVGWVKGLNRLYFLYEAYDDFWDFSEPGLHNDIFELVVDGDRSGGPLIPRFRLDMEQSEMDAHFSMHGVHAQNYHVMTPAVGKDWALAWGCQPWIKELPYANHASAYKFKQGEPGRFVLEFWITPFDYAGCEGPQRAVESQLYEDKVIGMSWAVIDYDGPGKSRAFWNLSRQHTMFGNASQLLAFRLMPLEPKYVPAIEARWSFKLLNVRERIAAFEDLSIGNISARKWDFGDGTSSTEKDPLHTYGKPGEYIVVLSVEGPAGKSSLEKIWDVTVR